MTPDIAVERKSLTDLIGSFNSGRLFTQTSTLVKLFTYPVLLIEFDEKRPFLLNEDVPDEISKDNLRTKLALLTLHFPQLAIFWCRTPFATAELFSEIKVGHLIGCFATICCQFF